MNVEQVVTALRNGAHEIETGHWYRGNQGSGGTECVFVLADGSVHENLPGIHHGGCLITVLVHEDEAQDAVAHHLGGLSIFEVFELNDSQPLETGWQWAIDTLNSVADAVEAAK